MDQYERSESLRREADSRYSAGDYAKAMELYHLSFDTDPNPGALRGIGECYAALGNNREATIYLAACVGMSPLPKALAQLSAAFLQGGHLQQAKRAAEQAIAALPHYEAARDMLAEIEQKIADGIVNDDEAEGLTDDEAKEVVDIAEAILAGSIGILSGCAQLATQLAGADISSDPDLGFMVRVHLACVHLPIGSDREHWNAEVLAGKDEEIAIRTSQFRDDVLNACRRIVASYSRT